VRKKSVRLRERMQSGFEGIEYGKIKGKNREFGRKSRSRIRRKTQKCREPHKYKVYDTQSDLRSTDFLR